MASESAPTRHGLSWREIHWARPLDAERVVGLLRRWAADQRSPRIALEARATPDGVRYFVAAPRQALAGIKESVAQLFPSTAVTKPGVAERQAATSVVRLRASTRHRALRTDNPELVAHTLLSALVSVGIGEQVILQLVLGPRRIPLAIPTNSPSSIVAPWWQLAWNGNGGTVDGEKRTALRNKVSDHGFACTVRIGVIAGSTHRRQALLLGMLAAIRTSEAPGVRLRPTPERAVRLDQAAAPWFWPLRMGLSEALVFTAWPLGEDDLPGQPAKHPKLLPPTPGTTGKARVVARATARGVDANLAITAESARHHSHILGPTGSGKSVMLGRLIAQDVADGRAVIVIEPKGDLVDDVLAHVPDSRRDDVVVLDASDDAPVGLNPLIAEGRRPEVVADSLLATFRHLYGDAIGPRSGDILYAATLTLARRSDASLVMLPLLLTNPGFRRSITKNIHDPIALEPFWAAYEAWSDAERTQAIAPLMNKLRPFLFRPAIRAVLGQREPRFSLRQVFEQRKILLVPLREGIIGSEAASLLGSLLVSEIWLATQARAGVAPAARHPVMVYIDELQNYLHTPTDLGDALAQARGYGVGFHLSHQYLAQLSPQMQRAIMANARSRICFQPSPADAVELAKGHPEVTPEDFTSLGQYEVYASLFANGRVTPYASGKTLPPEPAISKPDELRALSRARFGRPLNEIEAGWAELVSDTTSTEGATGRRPRRTA